MSTASSVRCPARCLVARAQSPKHDAPSRPPTATKRLLGDTASALSGPLKSMDARTLCLGGGPGAMFVGFWRMELF